MQVTVRKGKDVPFKERKSIHRLAHDIWGEGVAYKPPSSEHRSEVIFITVKDTAGKLLSTCLLEPVFVRFRNKRYKLWGISDVISVIKGKGYGKLVMEHMCNYIKDQNVTAVGFCARYNTKFYVKCNLDIAKNEVRRFIHKKKDGTLVKDSGDVDVVYLDGRNKFMKEFLAHKKDIVWIPHGHW
jgi:hypothetical protein